MNKTLLFLIIIIVIVGGIFIFNGDERNENMITTPQQDDIAITPIEHATMVLEWRDKIIYTDPVGGAEVFEGQPDANLILITDIHGDHLNADTLKAVVKEGTVVIAPQAVINELKDTVPGNFVVLANGEVTDQQGFRVEAIPMYNIPETADARHTKGRGNGYVIEPIGGGKRVYIAGDTSATPEMKALKDIDLAFVPMNLPFTMSVEEAAEGVLAFKPKKVVPYHYRGQDGLSDTAKFRDLVNAGDPNIEVDLMDFYPEQ